jgi:hypothetical protein
MRVATGVVCEHMCGTYGLAVAVVDMQPNDNSSLPATASRGVSALRDARGQGRELVHYFDKTCGAAPRLLETTQQYQQC